MELSVRLRKSFGSWDLDIGFRTGSSRLVVWGPSGSGKTVTLKLLAGLVKPDSGHITLNGRTLFDSGKRVSLRPQSRKVGLVFQNYALFPHLSVLDNLAFVLGKKLRESDEVVGMARMLEISHLLDRYPDQLSGGQCQRVAIGRALLAKPDLLLLDEPLSALDIDLRTRLRRELVDLLEQVDIPAIIVTHDLRDVRAMAEEVITFSSGRCSEPVTLPAMFAEEICHQDNGLCNFLRSREVGNHSFNKEDQDCAEVA